MNHTKWNEDRVREIYELALLGISEKEMASVIGIPYSTFSDWRRDKPEFNAALLKGKIVADRKVAEAFYKVACGYEYEEEVSHVVRGEVVKTRVRKYAHPDKWAANRWLSVRQREIWSESPKIELTQNNITLNNVDLSALTTEELMIFKKLGPKMTDSGIQDANIIGEENAA